MSENDSERYVDPNSGAAPQPGGFVAGGSQVPDAVANAVPPLEDQESVDGPETDSDASESYEGAQEHSAAPAGDQPDGSTGDSAGVDAQPEAGGGDSDSSAEQQAADGGDGGSEEEKDYSELLSKNVPEVQAYLDEHPDEADAVKAAEAEGENRKGIVEYSG